MTADKLRELVEHHEAAAKDQRRARAGSAGWHLAAAAALRELIEQKPVAWRRFEAFDNETAGWELYHDRVEGDEPLYAMPVAQPSIGFKTEDVIAFVAGCISASPKRFTYHELLAMWQSESPAIYAELAAQEVQPSIKTLLQQAQESHDKAAKQEWLDEAMRLADSYAIRAQELMLVKETDDLKERERNKATLDAMGTTRAALREHLEKR